MLQDFECGFRTTSATKFVFLWLRTSACQRENLARSCGFCRLGTTSFMRLGEQQHSLLQTSDPQSSHTLAWLTAVEVNLINHCLQAVLVGRSAKALSVRRSSALKGEKHSLSSTKRTKRSGSRRCRSTNIESCQRIQGSACRDQITRRSQNDMERWSLPHFTLTATSQVKCPKRTPDCHTHLAVSQHTSQALLRGISSKSTSCPNGFSLSTTTWLTRSSNSSNSQYLTPQNWSLGNPTRSQLPLSFQRLPDMYGSAIAIPIERANLGESLRGRAVDRAVGWPVLFMYGDGDGTLRCGWRDRC